MSTRERKCCPDCGSLAIQKRVKSREHYCMRCKKIIVPTTTMANSDCRSNPKFLRISQ